MKKYILLIVLFLSSLQSIAVLAQNAPAVSDHQPRILNLQIDQEPYDPSNPEKKPLTLSYELQNIPAETWINATISKESLLIYGWPSKKAETPGTYNLSWDGHPVNPYQYEGFAADGEYTFSVNGAYKLANGTFIQIPRIQKNFIVKTDEANHNNTTCAGYQDLDQDHENCKAITWLKEQLIMTGSPDGKFNPMAELERQQSIKIVLRALSLFDENEDYCQGQDPFPDAPAGLWMGQYLCRAKTISFNGRKMITGYESGEHKGRFLPGKSISRIEFLALLFRGIPSEQIFDDMPSYADTPKGLWYTSYAQFARKYDLFTGENLAPDHAITREEAAVIVYKLHTLGKL